MNSSGIKRGLAVSAISALAVAGIPALASSASATVGDSFTVTYTGPALNGGTEGALVIIRALDGKITPGAIKAVGTSGTTVGTEDTADQNVEVLGATGPFDDAADSNYEFIQVRVGVTTSTTGDTASFRLFEDDNAPGTLGTLDANEARQPVSVSTAGPLAKIAVSPTTQSTPQGIVSGAYTVTLQDAAGRTTQLAAGDDVSVTPAAPVLVSETGPDTAADDGSLTSDELVRGTDTFTADPNGAAVGSYNIVLADTAVPAITTTATLNVTQAATLTANEVDIVTGADSWAGFGGGAFGGANTFVRVDQNSIRVDIDADASDANSTVRLNLSGTGITFGGKATTNVTTVLDADGKGSLTITPDAGTVQAGDTIAITGAFTETLEFQRATVSDFVPSSNPYFSKVGGSVDVTFKVVDQFGLPITSGFVTAARDGVNAAADATPQKKAVGADGLVTFTFTDTKAVNGNQENVDVNYYQDEFTPVGTPDATEGNATVIKYTTDGMGANYGSTLDTKNTEAADYDATDVVVVPLADTVANDDGGTNESAELTVTGGEPGATMTISVDNGALILGPAQTDLSQGKASVTATLDAVTGNLPAGYRIVGTKSGVTTVTMSAANRTETAAFTVASEVDRTTARNVTVSGPAEVEHGTTQIPFTAVITDAFGNPVANVPVTDLNVQVTGPAQFQDSDAVSNAAGQINLNVRVDAGAEGDVTIKVQGFGEQFGAAADRLSATSVTDDGKGLEASSNVATATSTVKAAPVEPEQVDPQLVVRGRGGKIDRVKGNAIDEAAGARATLWKNGKKVKSGVLNDNGNITFRIKDRNGNKKTRYVVKIGATTLTFADQASKRIR